MRTRSRLHCCRPPVLSRCTHASIHTHTHSQNKREQRRKCKCSGSASQRARNATRVRRTCATRDDIVDSQSAVSTRSIHVRAAVSAHSSKISETVLTAIDQVRSDTPVNAAAAAAAAPQRSTHIHHIHRVCVCGRDLHTIHSVVQSVSGNVCRLVSNCHLDVAAAAADVAAAAAATALAIPSSAVRRRSRRNGRQFGA